MIGPLGLPAASLPRGTVSGLSLGSTGSIAHMLPVVTPAPAVPGAGRGRPVSSGAEIGAALTSDSGVVGGQGRLIVLAVTVAAGIAVLGAWFTMAAPGRRLASSLASSLASRLGRHTR